MVDDTRRTGIAALAVALAAALACGGGGGGGGGTTVTGTGVVDCKAGSATLDGKFLAPNGTTPISGGEVTISTAPGCKVISAGDGSAKFQNVPAGAATVTASKGIMKVVVPGAVPGTPFKATVPATAVKLAFVPGLYDNIQAVATGLGFAPTELQASELATANLAQYNAILLNCGLDTAYATDAATKAKLLAYVQGGGALYASDWASDYVDASFGGHIHFLTPDPHVGETADQLSAKVVDAGLKAALGKDAALINFNLGGWVVIDSLAADTRLLLSGPAPVSGATLADKPYAAQFAVGSGRVTYTSFHNEAQVTTDMPIILEQMLMGL